jgi:hypothetical protein
MNLSVNCQASSLQSLSSQAQTPPSIQEAAKKQDSSSLRSDVVEIQTGLKPALKGAAAGALGTGLLVAGMFALNGGFKGDGAKMAVQLTLLAAAGGAVGGANAANNTSNVLKGAFWGAAGGSTVGMGIGALRGNITETGGAALFGGMTGTVGGVFGAMVAEEK